MLGANGIVGAGAPHRGGRGDRRQARRQGRASAIAFSGDGACNQGTTFEAMNLAVVHQGAGDLRVREQPLFRAYRPRLCGRHRQRHRQPRRGVRHEGVARRRLRLLRRLRRRCASCSSMSAPATARPRSSSIPSAIFGHFEGDPQRYRGPGEVERLRETRDCLTAFRAQGDRGEPARSRRPRRDRCRGLAAHRRGRGRGARRRRARPPPTSSTTSISPTERGARRWQR